MSIYHKWETIFIQIPKCATTSIHEALRNKTDDRHDHSSYIDILLENDSELIEKYFSFSCVRNPYDRIMSAYSFLDVSDHYTMNEGLEFEEFIHKLYYSKLSDIKTIMYLPQYKYITIKNTVLVDKVIKFENLDKEWKEISKIINKKNTNGFKIKDKLPKINETIYRKNISYTTETKKMVYELYENDFLLFNYKK